MVHTGARFLSPCFVQRLCHLDAWVSADDLSNTMSIPAAALPTDLLLVLNDLEHVLSLNGLKGHQHTRYIADELQAKAETLDAQDQGKLDQRTRSRKRANELLLKHEAYEMCFDAFFQSCTMHQPSYQAGFQQKLWQHVMQLLGEWQDLHEHQQMQMRSLALDHLHLKQENKTLKTNLKILKSTVQTLLSDVSALLHHATSRDSAAGVPAAAQSSTQDASGRNSSSSNSSSRSSGDWRLQPQQSSTLPSAPVRRPADIVKSLISSIEKMTRQFAECQAGRLAGAADGDSSSRTAMDGRQQRANICQQGSMQGSVQAAAVSSTVEDLLSRPNTIAGEHAAAAVCSVTAATVGSQPEQCSTASSSSSKCSFAAASGLAVDQVTRPDAHAARAGSKPKAGIPPLAPIEVQGKHTRLLQPGIASPSLRKGRNVITAKSAVGPVNKHEKKCTLAGASPHRSHPPSAFDSSLAWFVQNAEFSTNSSSNTCTTGRHTGTSPDQAAAPAHLTGTPPDSASECQSATDSTSPPRSSTGHDGSAGAAKPQPAALQAVQSTVPTAGDAAAQPASTGHEAAVEESSSPGKATGDATPAVTTVAPASTPALPLADAAKQKQQEQRPEWMAALIQQPDALHKVRAAVRFALSPIELEPEPSVAEWATTTAHPSDKGDAVATTAVPAPPRNAGSSSGSNSGHRRQPKQSAAHAGELSLMNAAAAVAEQQGHSLSTTSRAGKPGYALAAGKEQHLPNASRFTHHQQQQPLRQARSGSADAASKPGFQPQGSASSVMAKRPASSNEPRTGTTTSYASCSSSNATAGAAIMGNSRSMGAGASVSVPAGVAAAPSWVPDKAAAGPLTAALQRQTSLQKQLPALSRNAGPVRSAFCATVPAGTSPPGSVAAAQRGATAAAAEQSRAAGGLDAASRHHPVPAGHACWGIATAGKVAAGVSGAMAASAKGEPGPAVCLNRETQAPLEQPKQQQGHTQRLVRKQDLQQQQQQHMAAVPEGQVAGASNRFPDAALPTARNQAFSTASSSVGSDMVRLGSCNTGFWGRGSAVNNGGSSPPEHSTASQAHLQLVELVAEEPTLAPPAGGATDGPSVAALSGSVPAAAAVEYSQLQSQGERGAKESALVAATHDRTAAQIEAQMHEPLQEKLADASASAEEKDAAAGSVEAVHASTTAGEVVQPCTAVLVAAPPLQAPEAADGSSHSIAASELKAEGSSTAAEAYSGLITAAAATAAAENESMPVCASEAALAATISAGAALPVAEHAADGAQELPDAVKLAQRCDSPRKQPRTAAAAAAAPGPSSAATSCTVETKDTADRGPAHVSTAVLQKEGQKVSAAAAAAASSTVPLNMRASGDKRTFQHSRSSLNSSSPVQPQDARAMRAMHSRPRATSSPVDDSSLSPLCKRLRSSLVLLGNALSELAEHKAGNDAWSSPCVRSKEGAAAAYKNESEPMTIAAGQQNAGITAKQQEARGTAASSNDDTLVEQQQPDSLTLLQQQQQHTAPAVEHRLSEDGGRDVGPVRDRDKSSGSKQRSTSTAAGNNTMHSQISTVSACTSHCIPQSSTMSATQRDATQLATGDKQSGAEAFAEAASTASSADSVIVSTASSSDMLSTATGQLAELDATATAASISATAPMEPEARQAEPEDSSSVSQNILDAVAADDGTVGETGAADRAVMASGEIGSCQAACQPPCGDESMSSSLELAVPAVLYSSPDLAAALGGTCQQELPAEEAATDSTGGEDLSFSLDELVAILIDTMHSKHEQDDRLSAAGLLCQTPTAFLQRYLADKVHGDRAAYSNALNALLTGLDAHKHDQPEVAVFCRILAGDIEENYFGRHLNFRSQLQYLAANACEQQGHQQQEQISDEQQQAVASWAACRSVQLHQHQLLWLLNAWSRQRAEILAPNVDMTGQQLQRTQREWRVFIRQRCCSSGLSASNTVSALLLWELEQHAACLRSTVEAFRAADQQHSGLLDLEQFRVFCSELNDTMSNEEVLTLWAELDKLGHGAVTFNTICSCLLPAMGEV